MSKQLVNGVVILCLVVGGGLLYGAFGEETFRAWNYGQAAIAVLVVALIVLKWYEVSKS